jgi:hypothetical protein
VGGALLDLTATVFATMLVMVAPGAALLGALRAFGALPPLLRPAASVAASVAVVSPLLVMTLWLHWSIRGLAIATAVATITLAVIALLRTGQSTVSLAERLRVDVRRMLPFVPPAAVLVLLGLADAPQVRSDTYWHVALARKLAELDGLSSARIAFEAGTSGNANYPLPAWHALLALADQLPRVDPWSAAWFSTLWLGPVAMLAFGAMAARLVGDRRAQLVGCWTFVAIVVLGYGPWFFATRYLAYPGQVAIFLVLPIVVAAIVEIVRADGPARRHALLVAASATAVIGVLHGNYVLYPALFAGGATVLLLLGNRDRWPSALLATGAVVGAGAATLLAQLPWIRQDDNFLRGATAPAGEPTAFIRHRDVFVGSESSFHVELGSLATQPWLVAGALALPALLFFARRRPGPWVLAGGAVAIVVFARLPFAAELLDRAGSVTPLTRLDRIYPAAVGVAALALGLGWLLERAWVRERSIGVAAAAAAFVGVAGMTWWLDSIRDTRRIVVTPFVEARWVGGLDPSGLPRVAIIASTIAIVAVAGWVRLRRRIRELDRGDGDTGTPLGRTLAACMTVAICIGLAPATIDRARATWEPQAFDRAARDDRDFTRIEVYPATARRAVSRLEPDTVVLAAFNDVRRIASLVPVRVIDESALRTLVEDPPASAADAELWLRNVDSTSQAPTVGYVIASRDDESFRAILDLAASDPCTWADRSAGTLRIYERVADGCRRSPQVDEP